MSIFNDLLESGMGFFGSVTRSIFDLDNNGIDDRLETHTNTFSGMDDPFSMDPTSHDGLHNSIDIDDDIF